MIYLILAFFVGLLVWGIIKGVLRRDFEGGEVALISIGGIFGLMLGLILMFTTLENGAGLEKWRAFYEANSQNYAIAVDETSAILSTEEYVDQALIEGSVEKWRQGEVVSQRIAEWRDAVNEYNTTIASMKYFNGNIFTGVLVPDGVEDMKLLIIK